MLRSFIVGLVGFAFTLPTAQAFDNSSSFAVIVGVGEFKDSNIEPRPSAEKDARAFYDLLANPKYFPGGPDNVILLTATPDDARKARLATHDTIVEALNEAVTKTKKDDTILFVMFGRGASAGDQTCLFTAETIFKDRAKTGLVGSDFKAELSGKERKICMMFDIAFRGFDAGKETLAEPNLRDVLSAIFGGDEAIDQTPIQDKVVVLSCLPSQRPLNKGEQGLFAAVTIEALQGKADVEGYAADGLVTVDELVKYLELNVPNQARELGKTPEEKEAIPFIVGEETAHFPITKNPTVTPTVTARLEKIEAFGANGTLSKELLEEGKRLVFRMPKLKADQELRKKYEALAEGTLSLNEFTSAREEIIESRKLPKAEAEKFTSTVLRAIEAVRSDYVKPISLGEWANFAITGLYRRLELKVPDEIMDRLAEAKNLTRSEVTNLLNEVRLQLGRREDLDEKKDANLAIQMMFAELRDPYTTYYDEESIKKMDAALRGEFRGVGIQIRRDLVRDGLLVVSPIKDSPAYKAGIQAGDLITAIKRDTDPEGRPLPSDAPRVISTKGMKTEKALDLILGKVGVPITLTIERDGVERDYTIRRGLVAVETILGVKRDENDRWEFMIDPDNKIGYICLTQFAPSTVRELVAAVEFLKSRGMKGLVLDLRFNPGGYLTAAIAICDLFMNESGVIVSVKYRSRESEVYKGRRSGRDNTSFPLAVLINGQSASASEIVAACLQDYNRAIVIGERSYGKGSVQTVKDFNPTNGQIKLTTARYFPPLGRNIDKLSTNGKPDEEWGVMPDKGYEIKLSREETQDLAEFFREREIIRPKNYTPKDDGKEGKVYKDRQLEAAIDYIKAQIKGT